MATKKTVCVIGIGRFGSALLDVLLDNNCNIIAIDKDEEKLSPYKERIQSLYVSENLDKKALMAAGANNADIVVIGIGSSIEKNLIASLSALEIGVKRVISKELSQEHGTLLRKIGAEPINVESAMGERIGLSLTSSSLDFLSLCKNFSIMEVEVPNEFDGKSIVELNLRSKYNVNILAVVKGDDANANIGPKTILHTGENLIISGDKANLLKFQEL